MSEHDMIREQLSARLEWLSDLGVREIVRRTATARPEEGGTGLAAGDSSPARPASASLPSTDLFGQTTAGESTPAAGRRRKATTDASPLAGATAPEAVDAAAALELIRTDLGDCRRCKLCERRTNIVFGVGNPEADLMFIGEGPGADEDRQGEPFVGRAGKLLTRIIEAIGYRREDVYIANVVKCRPPENRTPLPDEVLTCSPFLFQQVAAIRPKVAVCLGTPAAQTVLGTRETITRLRGSFRVVDGIRIMPTFHPAYLLRNPAAKREVWDDMKQVMSILKPEA